MKSPELKEHDVFVLEGDILSKMRRIVSILDGKICYSNGSDKNRFCKVSTFKTWARKAKKVHEQESHA